MIGFDSGAERRGFRWGFIAGLVAAGVVAMCMAPPAHGAPVWIAQASGGSTVTLYDSECPWAPGAQLAAYRAPDGAVVAGCWLMVDDEALIVYADGDKGRISRRNLTRVVWS